MSRKLTMETYGNLRLLLLRKLYSKNCWSAGHMLFERLQRTAPPHLRGFTKEVLNDLLKEELVLFYGKTKHGDVYQLNVKKLAEIERILET